MVSGLVSQLTSVQTRLNAEVSRAFTVEGGLHNDIDAERVARIQAVEVVSAQLGTEIMDRTQAASAAQGAEDILTGQDVASVSAHNASKSALGSAVAAERERA